MAVTVHHRSTLRVEEGLPECWQVFLARPDSGNALTPEMVGELTDVLLEAEQAGVRTLALRGTSSAFCSGMDLAAAGGGSSVDGSDYWDLLALMRRTPLLVVSVVEGPASGGGIGLVAAADVVLGTPSSSFALPEALWGLLPCCVAPFLNERIGRSAGLRMALLTTPIDASKALGLGLIDELVEDPDQALRQLALRVTRVDREVQERTKRYFARLPDRVNESKQIALEELADVMATPRVVANLARYAEEGAFPWEK